LEEGGEDDFAAAGFHHVAADDFFVGVVVAFDEDVGLEGGDEGGGGVFVEGDDVVDGLEAGEDGHAIVERVHRAGGAFEFAHRIVAVHADDQDVALLARKFEVLDVAGVEDVEDAVGEDDFGVGVRLAAAVEFLGELGGGAFFAAGIRVLAMEFVDEFVLGDRDDAELFDFQAAGDVGDLRRLQPGCAGGDGHGEGGEDHVARAGDIIDIAGARRDVLAGLAGLQEIHAVSVERQQAGVEVMLVDQCFCEHGGGIHGIGEMQAGRLLGFEAVRRNGRSAIIFGVIGDERGIDQHRLFQLPRDRDHFLAEGGGEQAFVVIFEGERIAGGQFFLDVGHQGGFLVGGDGVGGFLIEAEHLLGVAVLGEADEADLRGGRAVGALNEAIGGDAEFGEEVFEEASLKIVAADGDAEDLGAEGGQASRHIPRAAGALFAVAFLHDGDRRFGREAFRIAVDVFVDHHIAQQHDARAGPLFDESDEIMRLRRSVRHIALSSLRPIHRFRTRNRIARMCAKR
jgi:hypothetical protein